MQTRIWLRILAIAAVEIFVFHNARAATLNIPNGDILAFRNAISSANTNGQANTINLASGGMYLFTFGDGNHDALTWINSNSGQFLTINGNGATLQRSAADGTPLFRIFEISTNTAISDLTIANGNYAAGGGIRNITGNLTVLRCIFLNNLSSQDSGNAGAEPGGCGGAIHNATGNLTVQQCFFQGNIAEYNAFSGFGGGAIISGRSNNSVRGTLTVSESTFENNIAKGILSNNGVAARSDGGAIANQGNASITRCTFTDNSATHDGGALSTAAGQMAVSACLFAGNHVQRPSGSASLSSVGGAVGCFSGQTTLTNCTFYDNETRDTSSKGGAVYNRSPQLTITSCTFKDNNVGGYGVSCIYNESPSGESVIVTLRNTILDGRSDTLLNEGANASITSQGNNLSRDSASGLLTGAGDQINKQAKLDNIPKDNGGPTQTIGLLADSPAIDAGKAFGLNQDQRGFPRPNDLGAYPNASAGDGSDIGAFEVIDTAQSGSTFVVNTKTDHDDGICGTYDCSLRDAIVAANAASSAQTITFAPGVNGVITLNQFMGPVVMTRAMTISGPGARALAVSGGAVTRVFTVMGGPTVISGLTIRDGLVAPSPGIIAYGGGLTNGATLTLNDCAFVANAVLAGDSTATGAAGASAQGGAIYNTFGPSLTLNRCTFSGNGLGGGRGGPNSGSTNSGGNGGAAQGGAIYNGPASSLTLNNCTFYNNIASAGAGGANSTGHGGNGGSAKGAGIYNVGTMTMTSCTLRGNNGNGGAGGQGSTTANNGTAGTGAGGVTGESPGSSTLRNCLIAENTGNGGTDANGTFSSGGYNLICIGDFGSGFTGAGDQVGTTASPLNAVLGPLQNNGGQTDTIAPLTGSPALDKGKSFGLTTDERSQPRPVDLAPANATGGDGSDIGAFEAGGQLAPFSAFSRKFHGTAFYDVPLPLSGAVGIECRRNTASDTSGSNAGHDHEAIIEFGTDVAQVASVSVLNHNGATVSLTFTLQDHLVKVDLHGVGDTPERFTIQLTGVSDGTDTINVAVPMATLLGDTSSNGSVNATDVSQTKLKSGQAVDLTNFRTDVTLNGSINASDVSLIKLRSGTAIPAAGGVAASGETTPPMKQDF